MKLLNFLRCRPQEFILESKKENDYSGMPESDEDEDQEEEEEELKIDSMGNTIESEHEEEEES